jgi:hypothetical protein
MSVLFGPALGLPAQPDKPTYGRLDSGSPLNSRPAGSVWYTGSAIEGEVLTIQHNLSDADTLGTIHFEHTNSVSGVVGTDSSTYTVAAGDVGDTLTPRVYYTDGLGQAETKTGLSTATITASGAPYTPPAGDGLFSDGFETGDILSTNVNNFTWGTNVGSPGNNRTSVVGVDPTETWCTETGTYAIYNNAQICTLNTPAGGGDYLPYAGNYSLRFAYPPATNTEAEQRFNLGSAEPDLWCRFWLRVPTNFTHPTQAGGAGDNNKMFALWQDGYSQNGEGPTAIWEIRAEADGISSYIYAHYNMGGPRLVLDTIVGTFQDDENITSSDGRTGIIEQYANDYGPWVIHFFDTNDTGTWTPGTTVTGVTSGATANIVSVARWTAGVGNAGGDLGRTAFITTPDNQGDWMQVVYRVKQATSNTADDGRMELWRRWDGESTFTKLIEITNAIMPTPYGGPGGWLVGYLMGNTHGYYDDTEWFIDDVEFSTTTLV